MAGTDLRSLDWKRGEKNSFVLAEQILNHTLSPDVENCLTGSREGTNPFSAPLQKVRRAAVWCSVQFCEPHC